MQHAGLDKSGQKGGTGALIDAMAADTGPVGSQDRVLALAVAASAVAAALVLFVAVFPRPDFMAALHTVRFDFKFVLMLTLAATAYAALRRAMRPEMGDKPAAAMLLAAPAMLLLAVAMELVVVPDGQWAARAIGHNAYFCMTLIPVLSFAPLAILLAVLRQGATTTPRLTGALAGLLAAGVGAFFYAAHCNDDSPLFVAIWYPLAIAAVTAAGTLIGGRLLRW